MDETPNARNISYPIYCDRCHRLAINASEVPMGVLSFEFAHQAWAVAPTRRRIRVPRFAGRSRPTGEFIQPHNPRAWGMDMDTEHARRSGPVPLDCSRCGASHRPGPRPSRLGRKVEQDPLVRLYL